MGYSAYTTGSGFVIPADKVADALHALNVAVIGAEDTAEGLGFTSIEDAFAANTGFEWAETDDKTGFVLGEHGDKYHEDEVLQLLNPIAPFATEGSYVRFCGEDQSLWGFRVVNGEIKEEYPTWAVADDKPTPVGSTAIVKTTYTFTVLSREEGRRPVFDSLEHALAESEDGGAVGWVTGEVTVGVPDARVRAELIALGNDGEFFNEED